MNYIGSKYRLSDFIISTIESYAGALNDKTYAEIFAGTGIIARKLKKKVKKIIVNDSEDYSYVLLRNYIGNHKKINTEKLICNMNDLAGNQGFIFNNYCFGGGSGRMYFTDDNGKKIDAIRKKIEELKSSGSINEDEFYFLLASLIESADKVANTASVYGAYLKKYKKSALKLFELEPAAFEINGTEHEIYKEDANKLINKIEGDILYLDPPYNHRQYGANYHILNTIALYDNFIPQGTSGLRSYDRSAYCDKRKITDVFEELVSKADFKYIFLSYNNEGLLDFKKIEFLMSKYGKYERAVFKNYQRFKADSNREYKADKTTEYLHVLIK